MCSSEYADSEELVRVATLEATGCLFVCFPRFSRRFASVLPEQRIRDQTPLAADTSILGVARALEMGHSELTRLELRLFCTSCLPRP